MELLIEQLKHGLIITLILSLPAVLTAAALGLVIGILQAVTQVQEQTIAAAPKIIGVFAIIILGGGMMMDVLSDYIREAFQVAFNEIPQDGIFVLPPETHQTAAQQRARAFFKMEAKEGLQTNKVKEALKNWEMAPAKK